MNGLRLFRPSASTSFRRRRLIFVGIVLALAAMITWPVYSLFSAAFPLILGLPLSLAWIVLALAIQFAALLWLFLGEPDSDGAVTVNPGDDA